MAQQRTGLEVPKTPVRVELTLDGAPARQIELYVAEHLSDFARRQHVIDLLVAQDDDFLPVRDLADDAWVLVNKAVITFVSVPLAGGQLPVEEADATAQDELFEVRRRVEVHLVGGGRLVGELLYSPPAGRARVTDHLNDVGRFFRLWAADAVHILNKRYVARLIEL
jgi:hypothetical protein